MEQPKSQTHKGQWVYMIGRNIKRRHTNNFSLAQREPENLEHWRGDTFSFWDLPEEIQEQGSKSEIEMFYSPRTAFRTY